MTDDLISRAAALETISTRLNPNVFVGIRAIETVQRAIRALPAVAASQPADPAVKADSQQSVRMRPETTSEHIARDMREGRFPNKSEPQMVPVETTPAQVLDLIPRMDAIQACNVGPSDEWSKSTKSGYEQAATDCQRNILRIKPAAAEPQPDPRDAVIKLTSEDVTWITDSLRDYRIAVSRGPWDAEPMQRMLAEIDDLIDRYVAAAKGGAA